MNIKEQLQIQQLYNNQVKAGKTVLDAKNDKIDALENQLKKAKRAQQTQVIK